MYETHVIRKEDLLEMLSRFDGKSHIDVLAGGVVLNIDRVEYSGGSISIICHNDIEDERKDLEEEINKIESYAEDLESDINKLYDFCQDDSKTKEQIIGQIDNLYASINK